MKITVKTLKGNHFDLEVDGTDSVLSVKQKIEERHGKDFPAQSQLLIYQGKVLADDKTLAENNVTENGFLVVMTTKSKQAASPAAPSADATTSGAQTSASPAAPPSAPATTGPPSEPAVGAPVAASAPNAAAAAADAPASGSVYGTAASNLVAGSALESTIEDILAIGGGTWTRDDVRRALTAAYNNPERAIDYLYSGIPETAEPAPPVARPAAAAAPAVPSAAPAAPAAAPAAAAPGAAAPQGAGPNAAPLDLFPQGLGMGMAGMGGAAAGGGSLDFLRTNPQFQALRAMVNHNPQILQPMLQELGKQNPGLLSLINSNQEEFYRLIHEHGAEGEGDLFGALGGGGQPMAINVTQEENEAIQRLEALGFDRASVIEAFFACDKDEQVAANYLLEHAADED